MDTRKKRNRWTSLLLIVALLCGLLPAMPAAAAASITITSPSGTETNPSRVTSGLIHVKADITGIDASQIPALYYEVQNISAGTAPEKVTLNKAQQTGLNEITFFNVALTEGTNKITIYLGETTKTVSNSVFVLYSAITGITNLKIDGNSFMDGGIYPKEPKQRFLITGEASNALEVYAYVNGGTRPYYGQVNGGQFYFLVEDIGLTGSSQTDFKLRPGNNEIEIVAVNNTNSYRTKRTFIYDNGNPFVYDVKLKETSSGVTHDLASEPTVTTTMLEVSGKMKVDLDLAQKPATVTKFTYGEIQTNFGGPGSPISNQYFFVTNPPAGSALSNPKVEDGYILYDFTYVHNIGGTGIPNVQTMNFVFYDDRGLSVTVPYTYYYQDPNGAYVEKVHRMEYDGTAWVEREQLATSGENLIGELPSKLKVYVNANTQSITATLDGAPLPVSAVSGGTAIIDLPNTTPDGVRKLSIVPSNGSGPFPTGSKTYDLNITSVPYVIISNLNNGQILKSIASLTCGASTRCITGSVVNATIGTGGGYKLDVVYDGVSIPAANLTENTNGTFTAILPNPSSGTDTEGKHSIIVKLYKIGTPSNTLVTEKMIEFFLFSKDAPEFGDIQLLPRLASELQTFVPAQSPDMYVTNESYVRLEGVMKNASSIKVTVRKKNDKGEPRILWHQVAGGTHTTSGNILSEDAVNGQGAAIPDRLLKDVVNPGGQTEGRFYTYDLKLMPRGDTVIEIEITNGTVTAVKTITISREPLPYRILEPKRLVKNAQGEDQVNINSNFLPIQIEAEGADQVLFGKDPAIRSTADKNLFTYEVRGLKPGKNKIKFTVVRGTQKLNGEFTAFYTNTNLPGSMYKTTISNKMDVFDKSIQLSFPKGTLLKRYNPNDAYPILTNERQILFGIADPLNGRVDRETYKSTDVQVKQGELLLADPAGRFRPASDLYWIDAGTIKDKTDPLQSDKDYTQAALIGSGRDPYAGDVFFGRSNNDLVVPTRTGTLTLKFDPNIRDEAWKYVTVFHFDTFVDYRGIPGSRWRNLGGVVDRSKNTITVPIEKFGFYRVMYMDKSFDDVTSHPWARDALDTLYAKGIMLNKGTYSFVPNDPISRGEFATMLVKIFEIPLQYDSRPTFTDVLEVNPLSNGLYEYKYIETAARVGIVRGTTGGRFSPDAAITREDAAVMIARAADLKLGTDEEKVLKNLQKAFTDANTIDPYARAAVDAITNKGFIEGKENVLLPGQKNPTVRFDPKETFTRAEAAMVAMRVMKAEGKIPK
ncbi:S-layer homology domain-containing protein [Paenibacillus thermoaerophilus]|uniref:S-layer homology domain-containing protein n=1 Tax=Paenibacillus thermoaerophilus TaxID=1215385 RepID=A0ABW2V4Z1_9BACL|nr:S-layer homology domain-containing protein [Paenibacillus thermoaerophilus]TMV12511.1 S-layer homology domain-containing protein [Paenibacillus thermoaerophilus]